MVTIDKYITYLLFFVFFYNLQGCDTKEHSSDAHGEEETDDDCSLQPPSSDLYVLTSDSIAIQSGSDDLLTSDASMERELESGSSKGIVT